MTIMDETHQPSLLVLREPPLAWLVINRPAARNAVNAEIWHNLAVEATALAADQEIRVILVRGAGEQAFISGADVSEFPAIRANAELTVEYEQLSTAALRALIEAPQPVIAMINGLCFGGGVLLAMACDLRFAAAHARFAIPAARLGIAYPLRFGIRRLLKLVGATQAADLLLSARALEAEEALRIGLLNRVVAAEELETVTRDYAMQMTRLAPLALAAQKLAIQQSLLPESEQETSRVEAAIRHCLDSADYQEGIAAFLEKRKPVFTGS